MDSAFRLGNTEGRCLGSRGCFEKFKISSASPSYNHRGGWRWKYTKEPGFQAEDRGRSRSLRRWPRCSRRTGDSELPPRRRHYPAWRSSGTSSVGMWRAGKVTSSRRPTSIAKALRISESDPHASSRWAMPCLRRRITGRRQPHTERGGKKDSTSGRRRPSERRVPGSVRRRRGRLNWLEETIRSRWKDRQEIAQDARFEHLRANPRFRRVIGSLPDTIRDRIEGWRYDLEFLASEVVRLDPAYATGLPETFRNRIDSLRSSSRP